LFPTYQARTPKRRSSRLRTRLLHGILILLLATLFWIGFIFAQQYNYSEPDQVYIMGTVSSFILVFVFLLLLFYFIFSFIRLRKQPDQLKKRFYLFTVFYLIASPLVLLSFDNYLLVTARGIQYNPMFNIEGKKIRNWEQIEKLVLDYDINYTPTRKQEDLRLRYIIYFKDGFKVDLNNPNSPLFKDSEFLTIHRVLLKYKVPIQVIRPLPTTFEDKNSFIYQLFRQPHKI
jgi:amino acid transporter